MELILLEKIENLGNLGDVVNVRNGYARNYLLPQGKARVATAEAKAEFEARRAELERQEAEMLEAAKKRAETIEGLEAVEIVANAGPEGKLFGSVGPDEIVAALGEKGIEAEKREVRMPEGPIGMEGEYTVGLHLHADVDAEVKVVVKGEEPETIAT